MGCDIHMVVEQRHADGWALVRTFDSITDRNGEWSMPVARDRNYGRFARLAGVRGDGPDPLGLPADISRSARQLYDAWGSDAHSVSWMPLDMAADLFLDTEYPGRVEEWSEHLTKYPMYTYFGVEEEYYEDNYRLVFWFDN